MKEQFKRVFFVALPVVLSFLIMLSCSDSDKTSAINNDLVDVNLQVLTRSSDANLLSGENKLNTLRILVYNASDNLEVNRLLESGKEFVEINDNSIDHAYSVDCVLRLSSGKKTFCLIGNEGSQTGNLSGDLLTGSSSVLLRDSRWLSSDRPVSGGFLPSTCVYFTNNVSTSGTLGFEMIRSVGRVNMDLRKAHGLSADIRLTSVQVLNAASESFMFSGSSSASLSFSPAVSDLPAESFSSIVVPERNPDGSLSEIAPISMTPVYLYEYSPSAEAVATSIKISFTVDGDPKSVTLPLPIGKDSQDNWVYGVRRNTIAYFDLTIESEKGVTATCIISDWTGSDYDKIIGDGEEADDSNILYADWISAEIYDEQELEGHENNNGGGDNPGTNPVNDWKDPSNDYDYELSGKY